MKIFISQKAPHTDDDLRRSGLALAEAVRAAGHVPFLAWKEIEQRKLTPRQFMPFVREHLGRCDLVLILYHPEMRGGLIELGIAYAGGIPIWLIHQSQQHVSSSALGCADLVLEYTDPGDLQDMILERLCSWAVPHHK
jgi:nucleoside 2-deoxyribosyltransferase